MINAKAYINGKFVSSKKVIKSFSPIDNKEIGTVSVCTKQDIDNAYISAHTCFLKINSTKNKLNFQILQKIKKVLLENKVTLAKLMVKEIAKTQKDALLEIERSIEYIDKTVECYNNLTEKPLTYSYKELGVKGKQATYNLEPLGVILCITPFNYPINLLITKIAPALISGNTVVIKSATVGSLTTYKFIQLLHDEGIEKGMINLILGSGNSLGNELFKNQHLAMVSFTGSTNVGEKIVQTVRFVPIVLEMGGKDVAIILKDAHLESTVNEIIKGAFNFNGQRCTAIKRVLVPKTMKEKIVSMLNEKISSLSCGNPFDNCDITPLISDKVIDNAKKLLADAKNKGAIIHQKIQVVGNMLYPVLASDVKPNMKIWREEPFAPILPVMSYTDESEMIKLANDSIYGLQASIFTKNMANAQVIANQLDVGTININKSSSRGPDILPFFGIKASGFGVQGVEFSIRSMTRFKGIIFNKN